MQKLTGRLASIISMLVIGVACLVAFVVWDFRYASRPAIAPRFFRNRSVTITCIIGIFDFVRVVL